jgi:hypothetical protein
MGLFSIFWERAPFRVKGQDRTGQVIGDDAFLRVVYSRSNKERLTETESRFIEDVT